MFPSYYNNFFFFGVKYRSGSSVLEECYEFLYLVSSASEDGVVTLYKSGGMKALASPTSTFPDGNSSYHLLL